MNIQFSKGQQRNVKSYICIVYPRISSVVRTGTFKFVKTISARNVKARNNKDGGQGSLSLLSKQLSFAYINL